MESVKEVKIVVGIVTVCMVAWYVLVCSDVVRGYLYRALI